MFTSVERHLLFVHGRHGSTVDDDLSLIIAFDAADDVQQGRLTGTGWPEQDADLAFSDTGRKSF